MTLSAKFRRQPPTGLIACLLVGLATLTTHVLAADSNLQIDVHDHRFTPAEVHVAAHQRIRLTVRNLDSTAEEFESYSLNREKIVPAGATVVLYLGPLEPGRYPFFGDYHQDTASGVVVAE